MRGKRTWVGLDASRDTVSLCAINDSGEIIREGVIAASASEVRNELRTLKGKKKMVVGIETGDVATHMVRGLRDFGYDIRVLDSHAVSKFLGVRQNKTDRNDARGIADVTRLGGNTVPEVLLKTIECQRLRSELALRSQLMRQRIALENGIRAVLRINGAKLRRISSGAILEKLVRSELARLRDGGNDISEVLEPTLPIVLMIRRALGKITCRLNRFASENDICRRLMTVPGIGPICALSFYTAIEDPSRFKTSDDVAPYLGLVPKVSESGDSSHYGRITRRGDKMTRTYLHAAAIVVMSSRARDTAMRRWAMEVAGRAGRPKARTALARKLAVVMLAIWKSGDVFRPEGRIAH